MQVLQAFLMPRLMRRAAPFFRGLRMDKIPANVPAEGSLAERMHGSALFLDRDGVINVDRGYISIGPTNSSSFPGFSNWLVSGPMNCGGRSF
jgi:hypothetical protein